MRDPDAWDNNDYLLDSTQCQDTGGPCPFGVQFSNGSAADYSTFAAWKAVTGFDAHSTFAQNAAGKPSTNVLFVRPSMYERGRANIIVYNWLQQSSVSVDLSSVLSVGDRYNVYSVQNFFGSPVVSGTYGGGSISIPTTGVTPPSPLGSQVRPSITFPSPGSEFQAFVVRLAGQ